MLHIIIVGVNLYYCRIYSESVACVRGARPSRSTLFWSVEARSNGRDQVALEVSNSVALEGMVAVYLLAETDAAAIHRVKVSVYEGEARKSASALLEPSYSVYFLFLAAVGRFVALSVRVSDASNLNEVASLAGLFSLLEQQLVHPALISISLVTLALLVARLASRSDSQLLEGGRLGNRPACLFPRSLILLFILISSGAWLLIRFGDSLCRGLEKRHCLRSKV